MNRHKEWIKQTLIRMFPGINKTMVIQEEHRPLFSFECLPDNEDDSDIMRDLWNNAEKPKQKD